MWGFDRIVPCAAIASVFFLGTARLTGQSAASADNFRSFPLMGADDTLPDALSRVDAMMRAGELDVAVPQEDTMIRGRVHERLGQFHERLPVFGAQAVRQMDGRSVISITGRLYERSNVHGSPGFSPERARAAAVGERQYRGGMGVGGPDERR